MDSISQIKQRLSIVDVVGSYIELKKAGKNYKAVCPFHSEDTPSFMVSPELGIYKCFGCGVGGDIFSFVQEIDGIGFYEALKKLAIKAGVELENTPRNENNKEKTQMFKLNDLVTKFYSHLLLKHEGGKKGLDYLIKDRGLKMDVIEVFKLGYAPHSWEILYSFLTKSGHTMEELLRADLVKKREGKEGCYDKFRGRVIFPLIDTTGKILGFMGRTIFNEDPKYLNTASTLVFSKSDFVYGLGINRINIKKEGAVLVEGPMDVVSAYQYGIKNVVAPLGTALTSEHLKIISRYTKEVTVCFDSDTAGMEAIKRAVFLAEKIDLNVKVLLIPEPYKDLDELLRKDTSMGKELLTSAVSVYDFFIAYALRKYDRNSGMGKKKIVDELKSLFSAISSEVALDHYVKKIAEELGISESVIFSVLSSEVTTTELKHAFPDSSFVGGADSTKTGEAVLQNPVQDLDTYYFLLLFRLENIAEALPFVEGLDSSFFLSADTKQLLETFKKYVFESKGVKLDIKAFIDTIDERLGSFVKDLYLWELDLALDGAKLLSELESVFLRLEKRHAKSKIEELRKKLSLAEMQGEVGEIKEITAQIREYSKKII